MVKMQDQEPRRPSYRRDMDAIWNELAAMRRLVRPAQITSSHDEDVTTAVSTRVFVQEEEPTDTNVGDLWLKTADVVDQNDQGGEDW